MEPLKICYFSATGQDLASLGRAVESLVSQGFPFCVVARTQTQLFDKAQVESFVEFALGSDAVILVLHGGTASCQGFSSLIARLAAIRENGGHVPHLHIQPVGGDDEVLLAAKDHSDGLSDGSWASLCRYFKLGGPDNLRGAILHLHVRLKRATMDVPSPKPPCFEGVYHPELGVFTDVEEYARIRILPDKPTVGLWFFHTYMQNNNLAPVDAIIKEVEKRGANALAVFSMRFKDVETGNRGADEVARDFFLSEGKPRVDVLVNAMSMSMTMVNPAYKDVLPGLDVACLQALSSTAPFEVWKNSEQGLATMDVTFQAAQPEFDGALITVPVATREEDIPDPLTGGLIPRLVPIPDRVEAIVSMALKWAGLKRKTNADKRVAIVFHHYPPRNDRIGCAAGLDSFESVRLLLSRMRDEGFHVDRLFESGDELAKELLAAMTCDRRWLLPEELPLRAKASAGRECFEPWHDALPQDVRLDMVQSWGAPPGEIFTYKDTLHFPGFHNGNVFVTIQPPRGRLEKIEALYHELRLPPPHHYLAHYRYIRDMFQADAVIHVGKHGSLEWLPGKSLGLSKSCYPDLAIQDLPNIYPYIINDPSEGTQAKRRSYCCIVDHLTPSFVNADLYEHLGGVDAVLTEYADAVRQDPGKLPLLAGQLWEAVERADLQHDLSLGKEQALTDVGTFVERLHAYLGELADTMIADGLHVLGQPPEGKRLVSLLAQMTRLPNPGAPSLRDEILTAWGYDPEALLADRGKAAPGGDGERAGKIVVRAHAMSESLIEAVTAPGFDIVRVGDVVREHLGADHQRVGEALYYAASTLALNVGFATQENDAVMAALSGRFVKPGPSGAPTRGQADILPTGRNFYSLDPRTIPSPVAWQVGIALGDALLERHLKDTGSYPATVGIILWGGSTMRTKGDDIAEILYLLGVRPVWRTGGLVTGLELIPTQELGRPRIDVSSRISGFFRDAFPNLVELVDEAVGMVAALKEIPESNFVRRHVQSDLQELEGAGLSAEQAWRQATQRIFGCPPGTYGAGVAELVESKQWKTRDDLADIYIRYSAHPYGKGLAGKADPAAFKRVLGRMEVTVKNEDSREYDMMSCVDFYNYHGGLIAAAAVVRGADPASYAGDSADPRRVVMRSTHEEAKHVLRARLLNPKWLEGLKRHGYKGAGDISYVLDVVIGWDATAGVMEDWMYERLAAAYALDPQMQKWLKEVNPHALRNILDKLLETIERGMWHTSEDMRDRLLKSFLDVEGDIEEAMDLGRS
jgi:cobaltochelatase CobN